jgi:hypothetical protein
VLLWFLGPPGWIAAAVLLAFASRSETLTVRLPYHPDAWRDDRRQRAFQVGLVVAGGLCLLMAMAMAAAGQAPLWLILAVSCMAGAVVARLTGQRDVGVSLDASRRWVTLSHVHPDFVAATLASRGSQFSQPLL